MTAPGLMSYKKSNAFLSYIHKERTVYAFSEFLVVCCLSQATFPQNLTLWYRIPARWFVAHITILMQNTLHNIRYHFQSWGWQVGSEKWDGCALCTTNHGAGLYFTRPGTGWITKYLILEEVGWADWHWGIFCRLYWVVGIGMMVI